jgi:transcription initiation factor TFIID subunit TAF12
MKADQQQQQQQQQQQPILKRKITSAELNVMLPPSVGAAGQLLHNALRDLVGSRRVCYGQ